jgi:hypothetical protein
MSVSNKQLEASFTQALTEHNFKARTIALAKLGKKISKELTPEGIASFLESLPSDTFSALARLIVAQSACCKECPKALLNHPSQTVRFKATTLLSAKDAEEAFFLGRVQPANEKLANTLMPINAV